MTRIVETLDDMDTNETDVFSFNYQKNLKPLETLVSAVMEITVLSGTDPNPSDLLSMPKQIDGALVLQQVAHPVPQVQYHLRCTATTSLARELTLAATFNGVKL